MDDFLLTGADGRLSLRLGEGTQLEIEEYSSVRINRSLVERGGYMLLRGRSLQFDRPSRPLRRFRIAVSRPSANSCEREIGGEGGI